MKFILLSSLTEATIAKRGLLIDSFGQPSETKPTLGGRLESIVTENILYKRLKPACSQPSPDSARDGS